MRHDPIVDEVREAGRRYLESFKGDRRALAADLNRRAQEEGRQLISRPPVRVEMPKAKKAG